MSIRKSLIALFAVLCFGLSTSNAEERIAFRKHYTFPPKTELFFNPKFYRVSDEFHNLTYILCDDYDDVPPPERNCTVVHDTQPKQSCPVTLRTNNDGEQGPDYMEAYQFGSTRAVIVWPDYHGPGFIKCTILDFTTCNIKDVVLMENITFGYSKIIESTYFVAYDDFFELTMLPEESTIYQVTFHVGVEGNMISPKRWSDSLMLSKNAADVCRAIVVDSNVQAVYLQITSEKISLKYPNRWTRSLAEFPKYIDYRAKAVSTAHKTLSIASRPLLGDQNHVNVLLYDQDGYKLKLNTTIQYDTNLRRTALRNLADGGFLLFAVGSEERSDPWVEWEVHLDAEYLTRVDANGKVVGTIKRKPEAYCEDKLQGLGLQVFENEAKEYCTVVECSLYFDGLFMGLTSSGAQLDLVVKCFTDEDFLKSGTKA